MQDDAALRSVIFKKILERNARETVPFRSIHESNRQQSTQIDALQRKLNLAEKDIARLRQELEDSGPSTIGGSASGGVNLEPLQLL